MKTNKMTRILLRVLIVPFLLTMVIHAEETLSPETVEDQTNRILSESPGDKRLVLLDVTTIEPEDFIDPLIFDFTELAEDTLLGLGSPNPYQNLGVEFTGFVHTFAWGNEDEIIGKHLAARGYTEPDEPFVVRVTILDPKGALRVGGYVWPECGAGASVTAFDDAGLVIDSHSETDCSYTPFMGVAGTSGRPIRSVEWRGLPNAILRTYPQVDHVMIDLCGQGPPCPYNIVGDLNDDCVVNIDDIALLLENWLVDCNADPTDPACVPK